jgi:tetratricopeptide (TPR) repeat protein
MNNLALCYAGLGRHADALKMHEATLALRKTKLGPDHSDTLSSMNNLANSYQALGRLADALKLHKETLARKRAKLGPGHPDTLLGMYNLALCYAALGGHADALKLYEEMLALQKAKPGAVRPDTLYIMGHLAECLVKLDRGAEAVPIIDECLQRAAGKVVDPQFIAAMMGLRLGHFAKCRDAAGCRATAEMWEKQNHTDADGLYTAARFRAITAAVIRATDKSDAAAEAAAAEADRAMAWLQKAVAAGPQNAEQIRTGKDLAALREREDFKKLLADLAAKQSRERARE